MTARKALHWLAGLLAAYAGVCVLVAMLQDTMIYHPFHGTEEALVARAERSGLEALRDETKAVVGWRRARRDAPAANRLVVFHGNTGYALHRTHFVTGFERLDEGRTWEVILFEYPGFGCRAGKVGEASFVAAGSALLRVLQAEDPRPVYLLGESLGSGLACALAGREPERISGLFLLTPFARLREVAAHHFPWLPVRLILRDRWENVDALSRYRGPLAMLIADQDEVVTAAQGRLLFDSFSGRKRLWTLVDTTHNTVDFELDASWWREVSVFLTSQP